MEDSIFRLTEEEEKELFEKGHMSLTLQLYWVSTDIPKESRKNILIRFLKRWKGDFGYPHRLFMNLKKIQSELKIKTQSLSKKNLQILRNRNWKAECKYCAGGIDKVCGIQNRECITGIVMKPLRGKTFYNN